MALKAQHVPILRRRVKTRDRPIQIARKKDASSVYSFWHPVRTVRKQRPVPRRFSQFQIHNMAYALALAPDARLKKKKINFTND